MAAMAPALTEAATQVRAKLPTVGHKTSDIGRLDCPCPSPTDVSDVTPGPLSPTPRPETPPVAAPPPAPPALVQTKTTPSHLVTLSKPDTPGSVAATPAPQALNIGIRRVSLASTSTPSTQPLLPPPAQLQALNRAQLSNRALSAAGRGVPQRLVASRSQNPQIQRSSATAAGGSARPSGSGLANSRTGELLFVKTVDRMNQQRPTLLQSPAPPAPQTGPRPLATTTNLASGSKMPHPAAAPNINTKTPGMGYTFKTSTPQPSPHPQALSGPGGVAPAGATTSDGSNTTGSSGSGATPSTSHNTAMETDSLSLQTMEDIASITMVEIQSTCNSGMADVGLLNNVDRVAETAKRQKELERQAERLNRRIRRLQSKHTIAHVQHQLSGFVDHQHKNLQTMAKAMKPQPNNSVDLKAELLQSEDVKSLSTAALVSLVRRLQSSQAMTLRQRLANSHQAGTDGTSVLRLDEDLCTEMNRVSSTVQKDLKHLESALDSDATESSSGGESCDEDYDYDEEKVPKACLRRRAEWKWAMERAAVAAKWTWLQAQVSDLEYRIRQQSDIYRQIRAAKGAVVLGEPAPPEDLIPRYRGSVTSTSATTSTPGGARVGRRLSPLEEKIANLERKNEMSPCNLSTLLSNVDKQTSRLTQQLGNVYSPADSPLLPGGSAAGKSHTQSAPPSTPPKTPKTPNGFLTSGGSNTDSRTAGDVPMSLSFDPPSPAVDLTCQAARCRPVRSYGKRKLLTTGGLYQLSRKAARLSTVPCHCYPPVVPCAMCGGRYNNSQTVHPTVMPPGERVALIDPSYHQVLSFPQDTPLPIHFESLLRCGEWQHKPLPTKPLRPLGSTKGKQKGPVSERKYRKNAAALTAKLRNKYDLSQLGCGESSSKNKVSASSHSYNRHSSQTPESKYKKRKASLSSLEGPRKKRNVSTCSAGQPLPSPTSASPRDTPSPLSHSCPSSTLRDMKDAQQRRRRGESAFDINNIVIPYSMAASTRVEKLLYKEIITPKWRKVGSGDAEAEDPSLVLTPTTTPEQESRSRPHPTDADSHVVSALPPTPITPSTPQLASTSQLPHTTTPASSHPTDMYTSQTPDLAHTTTPHKDSTLSTPSLPDTPITPETPSLHPAISTLGTLSPPQHTDPTQEPAGPSTRRAGEGTEENTSTTDKVNSVDNMTPVFKEAAPTFKIVEPTKCLDDTTPGDNGLVNLPRTTALEENELEDLSEELIAARHMRCEVREKKRFMSVLKKRSRSSTRTDSMSVSDDLVLPTDVPDALPTPAASGVSVPSASSTPPGTPVMAPPPQLTALLDEEMEMAGERLRSGSCSSHEDLAAGTSAGRRRSLSGRLRTRGSSVSFTSIYAEDMQDDVGGMDPWACRTFPLSDADYDILFQDDNIISNCPTTPEITTVSCRPVRHPSTTTKGGYTYHTATPENSNPASPMPSSSNSSVIGDDPNDPEWSVVDGVERPGMERPAPPQHHHPGLVLKLAKR